jgi:hypothetical protein
MKSSGMVALALISASAFVAGSASAQAAGTPAGPPQTATIGQTISLPRPSGGPVAVTVVKVVNPDTATLQAEAPPLGEHLESVEFQIANTGHSNYREDPLLDITAEDADAQIVLNAGVSATTAGPRLPSVLNLAPGEKATGYVTFDVLEGDNITTVVYALNGGLFESSGVWRFD